VRVYFLESGGGSIMTDQPLRERLLSLANIYEKGLGPSIGHYSTDTTNLLREAADALVALQARLQEVEQQRTPSEWEGDLPTDHPNRCKLRDNLLYADIFNNDGSHRFVWRCHKRAGHDGPCSSHNDCGVMNGGVVCGKLPGHAGLHEWATEVSVRLWREVSYVNHDQGDKLVKQEAEIATLREQAQLYIDQREMTLAAKRNSDDEIATLRTAEDRS
jgi:hypothetical protein